MIQPSFTKIANTQQLTRIMRHIFIIEISRIIILINIPYLQIYHI